MNALFYIGPKGGEVSFVDADGVILRTLVVGAGVYATASFEKLRHAGERVSYPVSLQHQTGRRTHVRHDGHYDSAANPSFRVSPAQRQAKQLQALMARSEALNRSAQKALQAARRASRAVPQIEHRPETAVSGAGEVPAT